MKFIYIGECKAGEVRFVGLTETVVMPQGVAVEVPDWLGKKLAANSHFEAVPEAEVETDDAEASDVEPIVRRGPGRPRKVM